MDTDPSQNPAKPCWTSYWQDKEWKDSHFLLNDYAAKGVPVAPELHRETVLQPTLALLELEPEHEVLEIGCGSGIMLREIETRVKRAVGTDLSQAMLDRFPGASTTYCAPANAQPFTGEQFDRILMFSITHYFPDMDYFLSVLNKATSLLRRGGIFLAGDVILDAYEGMNPRFLRIDKHALIDFLDALGHPYSIAVQNRKKRMRNNRHNIIVYKD